MFCLRENKIVMPRNKMERESDGDSYSYIKNIYFFYYSLKIFLLLTPNLSHIIDH